MPDYRRKADGLALTIGLTDRYTAGNLGLSSLLRWLGPERDVAGPAGTWVAPRAELTRLQHGNAALQQRHGISKSGHIHRSAHGSPKSLGNAAGRCFNP